MQKAKGDQGTIEVAFEETSGFLLRETLQSCHGIVSLRVVLNPLAESA